MIRDLRGRFISPLRRDPWYPNVIRDKHARWRSIPHDPLNEWVLVDEELGEGAIRCATRNECREHQRAAGGKIMRTLPERRRA